MCHSVWRYDPQGEGDSMANKHYFMFWSDPDMGLCHWGVDAENDKELLNEYAEGKDDFVFTDMNMKPVLFNHGCSITIQTNGKNFLVWDGEPSAEWIKCGGQPVCRFVNGDTLEAYDIYDYSRDEAEYLDVTEGYIKDDTFVPVILAEYETVF